MLHIDITQMTSYILICICDKLETKLRRFMGNRQRLTDNVVTCQTTTGKSLLDNYFVQYSK